MAQIVGLFSASKRRMRFALLTFILIFCHGLMGCGDHLQSDQLIVGGKVLSYSDKIADYIVHISSTDLMGYNQVCTGIFVGDNAILTAAHCNKGSISVTFRTSEYKTDGEVTNLTIVATRPVKVPDGVRDDLVMLIFSEPFPRMAKMAEFSSFDKIVPLTEIYVAGYGLANTDKNDLKNNLAYDDKPRYKAISFTHVINESGYFLIDQAKASGGVCEGDSGGPAFFLDSRTKKMQVIGIASAIGRNCEDKSYFIKTDFLSLYLNHEVIK